MSGSASYSPGVCPAGVTSQPPWRKSSRVCLGLTGVCLFARLDGVISPKLLTRQPSAQKLGHDSGLPAARGARPDRLDISIW